MFDWVRNRVSAFFNTGIRNPAQWLVDVFSYNKSDTGVRITAERAIGYAPVWYAVSKISGHVAQLPFVVHRNVDGGSSPEPSHPAYSLLKTRPNDYQTAVQFKQTMMAHALLWGNGRAAIIRNASGMPVELLPLPPERTTTEFVGGRKFHVVTLDKDDRLTALGGTRSGDNSRNRQYVIPDVDCFHVPGLGFNGVDGLSIISVAKNLFGLGIASEKAASKSFANGSRPDVVLEAPRGVFRDDTEAKEFLNQWNNHHMGLDNHGKAGLLREGITAKPMSMSADDAQWVEQRLFQRQEVAMVFCLEQILGDDSSVSYNSLEQKNLAYLSNCLMPWLIKFEQEADAKLLTQPQRVRGTHFCKFNVSALLRADSKTQMETLSGYIASRVMSPNEARAKLDMLPYEGGDAFENPAITPGQGGQDDGGTAPEDMNRAAVVAHLRHLIGVECNQVLNAAGNKRNYIGWLDSHYEKWEASLSRAIANFGGSASLAQAYCEESKQQLLEIAGTVTADGLADAVSEVTQDWPDRAENLAIEILKGEVSHAA